MERYEHIIESKRHLVDLPDADRIKVCRHDFWIETERLRPFFECIENIMYTEGQIQASCIFAHGMGGDGKSALYERLQVMSKFSSNKMKFVELTESLDRYKLHEALYNVFGLPIKSSATAASRTDIIVRAIEAENIKAIVIDEFNEGLLKAYAAKRIMLSLLKSLSAKKLRMCIIALGNDGAMEIMKLDPAIGRRYVRFRMPLWTMNQDFINFISSYEANLPLKLPSNLADLKLRTLIMTHSKGIMDNVVKIIKSLAMDAIATGAEKINAEQFERLDQCVFRYGYSLTVHEENQAKPELLKRSRYAK